MYTLYHGPGTCSLAVKAALALTGADYTSHNLDMMAGEHLGEAFTQISPLSKVPALALNQYPDEAVLTEGSAILLFLSSQFPQAKLMPELATPAYGNALKWMQLLYSTVHPHWGRVFFPQRYGQDETSIKQAAESELHKLYQLIEEQLSHQLFIAGEQLTLADLYLMVSIHWEGALQKNLTSQYPHIEAYRQRMYLEPVIGPLYKEEFSA